MILSYTNLFVLEKEVKLLTYQELASKSFRERLVNNPNVVLDIDESVEVIVKENAKKKIYFVLSSPGLGQQNLSAINAAGVSTVGSIGTASTGGTACSSASTLSSVLSVGTHSANA